MRTIRLNAYGTQKGVPYAIFGVLGMVRCAYHAAFFLCRSDAYQGPQIEARTKKCTNTTKIRMAYMITRASFQNSAFQFQNTK
jgi:hypothetical protein